MSKKDIMVVGITGGMGTGQTTVAKYLGSLSAKVIHADEIAREVVNKDSEVRSELKKAFGRNIYYRNGKLNRKLLAKIVFEDEMKTYRLNKIVHPRMVSRIIDEIESARDSGRYNIIAIDAALIYELELEHMFDAIVVVTSKMNQRIKRIQERDGLSEKEIMDRINKQLPVEEKTQWADFVVENNRTLEDLHKATQRLNQKLLKTSTQKKISTKTVKV